MDNLFNQLTTVALAIVGVAMVATLVSRNANTSGVISSGGNAFSQALQAATGPVTGSVGGTQISNLTQSSVFGGGPAGYEGNTYF